MDVRSRVFVVVALGLLSAVSSDAVDYSPLRFRVRAIDYSFPVYAPLTAEDGAVRVYFRREPMPLRIDVYNDTDSPLAAVTVASQPSAALTFRATRDGVPVDVDFVVDPMVRRSGRFGEENVDWASQFPLDPHGMLSFAASIGNVDLPVGVYRGEMAVHMTDAESRVLRPQGARFNFEIRDVTPETILEVTLREAHRALRSRDYQRVRERTAVMLAAHPNSYAAYVLRAEAANGEQKPQEAAADYERALAIMEQRRDTLYLSAAGPNDQSEEWLVGLRARIATARAAATGK